jgi:hypothetical protein
LPSSACSKQIEQLIDPVGLEAEHAVGASVQDWLEGQAGCEMDPDSDATTSSSHGGDMGEVAVGLIGLSDIKQRSSDADLLTMDRVARVMRENGWRFQFVSPEEMDRRMEELSARRREFLGVRLPRFREKVALTRWVVISFS